MSNKGFTLIEMIFVLSIVSMITMLTMYMTINSVDKIGLTNGIVDFETKLEYLEIKSLLTQKPILVWFKPNAHKIYYQTERNNIRELSLYKGKVANDNKFTTMVYDGKGNINQFGTLKMTFSNKRYRVIFRIEKGRYKIVKEQ
ncbi:competence type IV pilus minor pilin ComGD [Mammaliicoccus stepanovicii]|uniref:Late competence protein ComGD, access of DNA to ComEA n=1 Tax=Mammaliicoccus stepanovicii TaxID=643214 RepID=A0A239Z6Q0_9STAP|nr:competence type IV pilus minor pilin ComGD [Mammaliicoccus stepanovicii]PNZ72738.1 prepilin-type cleavage/methylation domain-containing protein [Mammaliicoccus stepanovicii]GGI39998.1 competence protein ComG [Mammaliicoccus stepanovicii]SNV66647.1 Late competence protein ComGD, access of DNA to ComEA [Mammaliicoccus stepanovicii]